LRANGQAAGALLVTQISSCFAAATWALMSYRDDGKIQITHIASGALCGLAGITPGSGHVMPVAGVPIGILVGLSGWYGAYIVKSMVRLDDVLDVTSLQAFPGAIGSILVGFFATTDAYPCETPVFKGKACNRGTNEGMGVFYGGDGTLLGYQILAVLIMIAWAAFFTWVTMKIIQQLTGLDISADEEKLGLDLSHHGEKAYDQDVENDESDDRIKVAELIGFAKAGDVEGCRKVITKMGLHPSKGDVDGRTGLHLAARFGQLATVKLMIEEYNVDVDIKDNKGKTPLQDAQEGMHQEVIGYLKNKNAHQAFSSSDVTKMLGAAASGNLPVLNQFLISNMDPNSHDYDDRTALHLAAASGHENSVKLLLNNGADAAKQDRWGGLALHDSKRKQHQGITAILSDAASGQASVKYKVDMSAVTVRSNQIANSVTTQSTIEVLAAALEGNVDELKRLKKKGANLLEGDYDGRTALHQACAGGHLVVVQFLAGEKKANINVQDNDRHTPLSDAVNNGHADVVTFLKSSGATMNTSEGRFKMFCFDWRGFGSMMLSAPKAAYWLEVNIRAI
jgi:ankyrin repeat protein